MKNKKKEKVKKISQQPEKEKRKQVIKDKDRYKAIKKYLIDKNADFIVDIHGSSETIEYKDQLFQYVNVADNAGHGHHLSRIVKKDVQAWLDAHGAQLLEYKHDYKEQLFNIGSIEKVLGIPSVAIDINDCYWTTAYKLGYITEKTYVSGRRKKEWKKGRNASIGGLAAPKIRYIYRKGKINAKKDKMFIPAPQEHQHVRNHIIGTVYNLFYKLFQEIGSDFYMFLTDCVFTDFNRLRYVENYFSKNGYRFKYKTIEFTNLDRAKKRVSWYDFTAKCRNDGKNSKCEKKCGCKDKYYEYANHQIISDGLLEGKLGADFKQRWENEKEAQRRDALKETIKLGFMHAQEPPSSYGSR